MNQKTENNKQSATSKLDNSVKKLFIGACLLSVLSVVTSSFTLYKLNESNRELEDARQKLAVTMNFVAKQQQDIPKVRIIDFSLIAKDWANVDKNVAVAAMDTVIKDYNNKGYVLINSQSVIGDIKPLLIKMPKPENIKAFKK